MPTYLTTEQCAAMLGMTKGALEQRRRRGNEGHCPPYVRLGRATIRYELSAVQAWLAARTNLPQGAQPAVHAKGVQQ